MFWHGWLVLVEDSFWLQGFDWFGVIESCTSNLLISLYKYVYKQSLNVDRPGEIGDLKSKKKMSAYIMSKVLAVKEILSQYKIQSIYR